MPKMPTQQSFKYQVQQTIKPSLTPLGLAIGGALTAGSLQAATITVTTLQDGNVAGECSLRSAIYASNDNAVVDGCAAGDAGEDSIVFDSALNGTINLVPGTGSIFDGTTLRVTEAVSIDGNNRITVQGAGDAPVIYSKYSGGNNEGLTVTGLTVTGGGGSRGGGILSTASSLEIRSSTITGNSATDAGGGIFQESQGSGFVVFVIQSSEISNNSATGAAGVGGGIYTTDYLQLLSSDIVNNQATLHGGAIARYGSRTLNARYNEFSNNTAETGSGGAIYSYNNVGRGASIVLAENSFVNNTAELDGGAVSITDTSPGDDQPAFTGQILIRGTRFETNTASGRGGAMFISKSDRLGPLDSAGNQVEVIANPNTGTRTAFQGNSASGEGGGLYFSLGENTVTTLGNTDFIANSSVTSGGGGAHIITGNGGVNVSRTVFAQNRAYSGSGGGLLTEIADGGDFQASTITSYANYAQVNAGGLSVYLLGGDLAFRDSYFGSNSAAQGAGGGLQVSGEPGLIDIERMIFRDNSASTYGGGLDLFTAGNPVNSGIKYSEFSNNSVPGGRGGAAYLRVNSTSNFFLANSTISGNSSDYGGGVYARGAMNFNLKYSTLALNEAGTEGGGLLTNLSNSCTVGKSLLDLNEGGASAAAQDIRRIGASVDCEVASSLLSGDASEFVDDGGNILGQPSLISALNDWGGSGGRTHLPDTGSPAIDAAGGAGAFAPDNDQRGPGYRRQFGAAIDMGAHERQPIFDTIFNDRFETP